MKRYLLFGYNEFNPRGGMNDAISSFNTIEEAADFCKKDNKDFYNLLDMVKMEWIKSFMHYVEE